MKTLSRVAVLLAIATLFVAAQDTMKKSDDKKMAKKAADMPMGMPMPKPSPEMQKMSKMLAGTWTTSEMFEVSDMMPKGGKGKGMAVIKPGPGGLSLVEEYHSKGGLGAFSGHGVFWWDDQAKGFKNIWCDTTTPTGCTIAKGLGNFDGDKLVFNDEQEMMGKNEVMQNVLTPEGSGITMVMSSGENAGAMKKMMTIKYSKPAAKKEATPAGE